MNALTATAAAHDAAAIGRALNRFIGRVTAVGDQVTPAMMRDYGRDTFARGGKRPSHVHAAAGWDAAQREAAFDAADATGYDDGVLA